MLGAIDSGYVHREIQESSVAFQKRVDSGERVIVGLNAFQMEDVNETNASDIFEVDRSVEAIQCKKLAGLKQRRDADRVARAVDAIVHAVECNDNLMPSIIDAVKAYATVGEICNVLREKWGEFKAPTYI